MPRKGKSGFNIRGCGEQHPGTTEIKGIAAATLEQFLHEALPNLMGLAVGLTGQRQDAEDLLQETAALIMSKWGRVRRAKNPEAHIQRIMVNTLITRSRRKWHSEIVHEQPAELSRHGVAAADHAAKVVDQSVVHTTVEGADTKTTSSNSVALLQRST
ncbi:MAG: sigma factor [Beutenbergiaceae bacterium]